MDQDLDFTSPQIDITMLRMFFMLGLLEDMFPLLMGVFIGNSLRGRQSGNSLRAAINQSVLTENLFVY